MKTASETQHILQTPPLAPNEHAAAPTAGEWPQRTVNGSTNTVPNDALAPNIPCVMGCLYTGAPQKIRNSSKHPNAEH